MGLAQRVVPGAVSDRRGLEGVAEATARAGDIEPRSFPMAVECTGDPSGLAVALAALVPRGTLVLKSTYPGPVRLDAGPVVVDELRLVGSRCGPFDAALRMLEAGEVDVESLIDARYPLQEAAEAFAHSRRPGILKVLLDVDAAA